MSPPTSPLIRAAEELELDDTGMASDQDEFVDIPASPVQQPSLLPSPSTSKVKAAAALWGGSTNTTSKSSQQPSAHIERPAITSSSSFRSIPPSSARTSPQKMSPEKLPSKASSSTTPSTHDVESSPDPPKSVTLPAVEIMPVEEDFAEVSLTGEKKKPDPDRINTNLSPSVRPKTGFFSSALGFGYPSPSPSPSPNTNANAELSAASSRSPSSASQPPSATSAPASASTWRSTMTNLFAPRTVSSATSPSAEPTSSPMEFTPSTPSGPSRNPSTSFILYRLSTTSASHDRRISRELGGGEKLREGFERVRVEMEGAAREMKRERQLTGDTAVIPEEGRPTVISDIPVDWGFWGAVVQDYEEVARTQPKELSKAIQQGIPPVIRGAIWQLMSSSKDSSLEESYKALLKMSSPHEKAIVKDLARTFPHHQYFKEGGGVGQESLFMVVKAYSLYDQEVGYTQGLAFIVAALLLNMPDEEAYCVLVRLMDSYNLRSHFLPDMPGLQLRLFQFDRLLEEVLPLLHTHFVRKGVKSSMFASQWFMTLFSYRFPLSLVYRVLDIVFAEGIEAIFRFSLALLQKSEDKLLELEFEDILNFLQTDLFEVYRLETTGDADADAPDSDPVGEKEWRANEFVRDAYDIRITPFMLDSYEQEYHEQCRSQNKHALELDQLRNANRHLSAQVKQLEASLAAINQEHVELVRQLVMSKIEKEETANELVRVKLQFAEMAHAQQDAMSTHSRMSTASFSSPRNPQM